MSLLLGQLNVRLGYWWNSGIAADRRPGRYPPGLLRRILTLPNSVFTVQAMLLDEWRGHFEGPQMRRWYLSDGGHFENSGLYELIRRRLPLMIAVDAARDPAYALPDLAILMRQVRLDFGAEIHWLDPGATTVGTGDWSALDAVAPVPVPAWIKALVPHPETLGSLARIGRTGPACGAIAWISYDDDRKRGSWLILVKANLAPPLSVDVQNYATGHLDFPNESTFDQFFDDGQWESYRALGEGAGRAIFT
jgi:hypothetical protein